MTFPLPNELIGFALIHLDAPSLLRCMRVCKLFHSVIQGNIQLVYKIELFASSMDDNESSPMDTLTRLNTLREYNRAWNNMDWTSSGTIPMSAGHCWEFAGGVLAQSTHANEITFVQLPCNLKGIEEKRWTVPFDFAIRDFTFDNSQDLIVLIEVHPEGIGIPTWTCKLHLQTLSGEKHPSATTELIIHRLSMLHSNFSFSIQICGSRIGFLCYHTFRPEPLGSFLVWNWHTGHQEVYIQSSTFKSFAFMTEDMILAANLSNDKSPTLQVMRIASSVNPSHALENVTYECELQYPQLQGRVEYILIRSDPSPAWRPPPGSQVPFYSSRSDFIFTVSLHVFVNESHETTVLFVPLSTLLLEVERSRHVSRRTIPWNAWGPDGTYMIRREPSETWVCYTYGMKYIQGLKWKKGNAARVYDFNPYSTQKHVKTAANSALPWKCLVARSKPGSLWKSFDDEGVVTMLPGRVANVALTYSEDGWEAPMIGEDHILMVQPRSLMYGYMGL